MITRKALDECLTEAEKGLQSAPPDGILAYLIEKRDMFIVTKEDVEVIAIAYNRAKTIEARP
jgi:hypothetical protein